MLSYTNYARSELEGSTSSNHGNCAPDFAAGWYNSRADWTQLKWLDRAALTIDVTDRTHATLQYGIFDLDSQYTRWRSIMLGYAWSCAGRAKTVIDLRGTPYSIAGATASCSKSLGGGAQQNAASFECMVGTPS